MAPHTSRFVNLLYLLLCAANVMLAADEALADPHDLSPIAPANPTPQSSMADDIRREIEAAIAEKKLPGCVVLVGWQGQVIHRQAYGHRQLEPSREMMSVDTVFDLASLTKPIATATSVMILLEREKLRLDDPLAKHLPDFAANGKQQITVEQLLLHTGGLIADNPLADYDHDRQHAVQHIFGLRPVASANEKSIYSDVGFIVLGLLVEKVSERPLDEFAHENIFQPLGMNETMFRPKARLRARSAPADKREGEWLVGEVHDPRAAKLGGVAGHAGLFSTADDLARYARMMMDRGRYGECRILKEATWTTMTTARDVPAGRRALGWDVKTGYSTNRGGRLSDVAFGHGGFTGTVLWIDPRKQLFVIFLSNRLHPDGKGIVNPLAGRIADIVVEVIEGKSALP